MSLDALATHVSNYRTERQRIRREMLMLDAYETHVDRARATNTFHEPARTDPGH